jgi:hypothetical protein
MQEIMRKVRLGLMLGFSLPCLVFIAAFVTWKWWSGEGTVHVHAPPRENLTIEIDGQLMPVMGAHFSRELSQGIHRVAIHSSSGAQAYYEIDVDSGFWSRLLPVSPAQCWVDLDVYDVYYAREQGPPEIEGRHDATGPIDLPSGARFSAASLPSQVTEDGTVHLFREVPCSMLNADDGELLDALGY